MTQPLTPPPGTRWKGHRRKTWGYVLAVVGTIAVVGGIFDRSGDSPVPGGLLLAATGAGLIWWGRHLEARRTPVPIKAKEPRAVRTAASAGPATVWDVSGLLAREGMDFVRDGRLRLYTMERHEQAVYELISGAGMMVASPLGEQVGAMAVLADVVPEPTNSYDKSAVAIKVGGATVAYLSLGWKNEAHDALRRTRGRLVLPVVLRWWGHRGAYAWALSTLQEAEGYAAWLRKKDRGA